MVFKGWKSGYGMQELLHQSCTNEHRVRACIYMLLLVICLVVQKVYLRYYVAVQNQYGKTISLLKLSVFIGGKLLELICWPPAEIKRQLAVNCCYDKRKDRVNMNDFMNAF